MPGLIKLNPGEMRGQTLDVVSGFRVHAKADTQGVDTGRFVHPSIQGRGDAGMCSTGRPHRAGPIGCGARRDTEQITDGT